MSAASDNAVSVRMAPAIERAQIVCAALFKLAFFLCLALYGLAPQLTAADFGWHLSQAEWMLRHLTFLRQDVFNYPNLNAPLIGEYPFYQVVIWLAWRLGEMGAALLCSCLLLMLYSWYFRAGRRLHFPSALLGATLLLSLVLALGRFTLRPEIATSLGIVFFITFLLRHHRERDWTRFWPLIFAQVLWVNSHSGFILGPAFVIGFGGEMTLRAIWRKRQFPRETVLCWVKVSCAVLLACLATPYGWPRLWLPFYHQGNELIRAYVTEMQPVPFDWSNFFVIVMLLQLALIGLACLRYRGGLSWSLLAITLYFFNATFTSERHLAVFALLAPGVALSAAVFDFEGRDRSAEKKVGVSWRSLTVWVVLFLGVLLLLREELNPASNLSPFARWRDWNNRRTELPRNAVEWMQQRQLNGRLFHRSEFGGWLQYVGYNAGQTYCDTGFGKYREEFIREIGRMSEQPASLPALMRRYQPDIAIVANMGYTWPYYLKREGWRCVFYAPDGSVWLPATSHPELPAVTDAQVQERFASDLKQYGLPARGYLFYRWLLTLQSMGQGEFAVEQMKRLPENWQSKFLFWEVARKMICTPPFLPAAAANSLRDLSDLPPNRGTASLFRAQDAALAGDWGLVIKQLGGMPRDSANDTAFTLLAEAYLMQNRVDEAVAILREDRLFTLANARRYELLARVEELLRQPAAASHARERAEFFGPIRQ